MFWIRFEAFVNVENFKKALMNDTDMPSSAVDAYLLDESDTKNKKALAVVKRNKVAWAHMTLGLNTEALLTILNRTKGLTWPSVLAHKVVTKLKNKYQPNDTVFQAEIRRRLNQVGMGKRMMEETF